MLKASLKEITKKTHLMFTDWKEFICDYIYNWHCQKFKCRQPCPML